MKLNPKFEYLNSKQIPSLKLQCSKQFKNFLCFSIGKLDIKYCLGFSVYDLEFNEPEVLPLNTKHEFLNTKQISTYKYQFAKRFRIWKIGICDLFRIYNLDFSAYKPGGLL